MLKLNTLFSEAGLNPANVRLARHHARGPGGITPYHLWRNNSDAFQYYQSFQVAGKFEVGGVIAAFVVSPIGETIFAGLYENRMATPAIDPILCPVQQTICGPEGFEFYDLAKLDALAYLEGRLSISWGPGYLAWSQRASNQNKIVEAIHKAQPDPPFPGLHRVSVYTDELYSVPESWRIPLSAVGGVYLLVCTNTGEQYVWIGGRRSWVLGALAELRGRWSRRKCASYSSRTFQLSGVSS